MLLFEILKNGIFSGSVIGLMAIAFSLTYKVTRVFHIAIGAIFLVSGYTTFLLSYYFQFPLYLLVLCSILSSLIFSLIIELTIYRKLDSSNSSGSIRLIGSLSILIITISMVSLIFGNQLQSIPYFIDKNLHVLNISFTTGDVRHILTSCLLFIPLYYLSKRGPIGIKIRALAENPTLMKILGKNILLYRIYVVIISSILIGISSTFITCRQGIDPYSAWPITLGSAVAVIIGIDSLIAGPFLAAIAIGCLRAFIIYFISGEWADFTIYFILLLVVLLKKRTLFE
jgi:branched-chain amino acid transport system permease protein